MSHAWLLWAFLSALFAAATAILSKVGLRHADPDLAQFVRTAIVLVVLTSFLATTGRWRSAAALSGSTTIYLRLAGVATAASWMCYFRALQAGDAARVAAIDKLSVPLVAIIAVVALEERLGPTGWLGVALTAAGASLIALGR
jgi:transporter family protein